MKYLDPETLDWLWYDSACREERLRRVVTECQKENPPPAMDDEIVATYFLALRTTKLEEAAGEIAYHATSGTKNPPSSSLLAECTATGVDRFDRTGRIGLLHMAFPLKMMLHPDGHLTSTDIMHSVASPIIFDVYEPQDARLVGLQIPEKVMRTFPGPAHGPAGLRRLTGFALDQPAFGTILKPTAGITPNDVGRLVDEAAKCPLFLFVKEDENLFPHLDYSLVAERTRKAVEAIERAADRRGGLGLIFAPHITGAPQEIVETLHAVLEAGATGVMFSETWSNGTVRMIREATQDHETPPAIYGHNAGIGVKTRTIWREIIDLLARLDGIDFRQTAPVKPGAPFLLPYGAEWTASEEVLSRPLPGINPTMIVRAGGLDQGNIGLNLAEVENRGATEGVLYLAGSAINSIRNGQDKPDPEYGATAMMQSLEVHRSGELRNVPMVDHSRALMALAGRKRLRPLQDALAQRYPELVI